MALKKGNGTDREALDLGLRLALDHLENVQGPEGGHGSDDYTIEQERRPRGRTQPLMTGDLPLAEALADERDRNQDEQGHHTDRSEAGIKTDDQQQQVPRANLDAGPTKSSKRR